MAIADADGTVRIGAALKSPRLPCADFKPRRRAGHRRLGRSGPRGCCGSAAGRRTNRVVARALNGRNPEILLGLASH